MAGSQVLPGQGMLGREWLWCLDGCGQVFLPLAKSGFRQMTQGLLSDTFLETHVSACTTPCPCILYIHCTSTPSSPWISQSFCHSYTDSHPFSPSNLPCTHALLQQEHNYDKQAPPTAPPPLLYSHCVSLCYPLSCQRITRVKKIDEDEEEGTDLTAEEIAALSQGTMSCTVHVEPLGPLN